MSNENVTAPDSIFINGALAFAPGDPVPAGHAEALGLTGANPPEGPISATADETGITGLVEAAATDGPPPLSATKAAWVDYAVAQGLDRDGAEASTKAELVEQYGSTEGA
jgi:hypothetical protein